MKRPRDQQRRDILKQWMQEYRKTLRCDICGEDHPACLSFHHIDPSQKKYQVSEMPNRGCSIELMKAEIDKCQVLCHNCHAKLHHEEAERPFMVRLSILSSDG